MTVNFYVYRITGLVVSERDVVIQSSLLTHDDKGQIVVEFYIQATEGFVTFSTIKHSVEVEFSSIFVCTCRLEKGTTRMLVLSG